MRYSRKSGQKVVFEVIFSEAHIFEKLMRNKQLREKICGFADADADADADRWTLTADG